MKLLFRIALRHLWSKHNFGFISFSTFFSIIGLMLGVSSLIIISCISDGFNEVINSKLSGIDGHMRIRSYLSDKLNLNNISDIDSIIHNSYRNIHYTSPYIEKHAIVRKGSISKAVIIYGVDVEALDKIFHLNQFTQYENKFSSENSIIIGNKLAKSMNINRDDEIILIDPAKMISEKIFKAKKLKVVNKFQTDFPEYDRLLAFIPLKTAQEYFEYENNVSGLIINVDFPQDIGALDILLSESLKMGPYIASTWKERHASLLDWLNIYDIPIKLIMYFITTIAIFNIGASLWMIIIEKTRDYGILQSLGLANYRMSAIIIIEGLIVGFIGSIMGVVVSLFLLVIEDTYHFIKLPNDIYFMNYLPVQISPIYFVIYPAITIFITMLFAILPASRVLQILPSEALRYE